MKVSTVLRCGLALGIASAQPAFAERVLENCRSYLWSDYPTDVTISYRQTSKPEVIDITVDIKNSAPDSKENRDKAQAYVDCIRKALASDGGAALGAGIGGGKKQSPK